ncbi:MAG: sugar transport system, permease protein [Frankiales bacterium]|nr:sugar transport system, permease protein [Frankiales bacterium]
MGLPFVVGALVLVVAPAVVTAGYAFTTYDGLSPATFNGLGTFRDVLADPELHNSLRSTGWFLLLAVPLRIVGGLLLALLADGSSRLAGATRVSVFAPSVIPDPATALIWLWVVNPLYGPLGAVLRLTGGTPGPVLIDTWGARLTIVALSVFALGEGFLVTLAARRELPESLYDAARVEGARPLARFRRITLPLLAPVLLLLTARDVLVSMTNALVPTLLLTRGGPLDATKTLPLLVYERGFREGDLGEGAALAVLTLLLGVAAFVVALLALRAVRRWSLRR